MRTKSDLPGFKGDPIKLHPVDKIDAKHNKSLVMKEKERGVDVPPWEGTRKNETAKGLWRSSTSIV